MNLNHLKVENRYKVTGSDLNESLNNLTDPILGKSLNKVTGSNLNNLTDHNLNESLKRLATIEREILAEIISHIIEVEVRKLHLKMGYGSLFEYLTQHIGYSNGSAQRRIDAARLARVVPKVMEDRQSGDLNLSQVSLIQKSIRAKELSSLNKVDLKLKSELVELVANRSMAESEVLVAQRLDINPIEPTKTTHQSDESVRLEVTLTRSQWEKLLKMRELLSNSLPDGSSWGETLEVAADKITKQLDKTQLKEDKQVKLKVNQEIKGRAIKLPKAHAKQSSPTIVIKPEEALRPQYRITKAQEKQSLPTQVTKPEEVSNRQIEVAYPRQHIPIAIQRKIFQRDQCCQYTNKSTGKMCGSRWKLNIDHIHPVWANGNNTLENLRLLCAAHNQDVYRYQAQIKLRV